MTQKKGVWTLQQTRDQILAGVWNFEPTEELPASLFTWGYGASGILGLNTTISRSSPSQVPGANWRCVVGGGMTDGNAGNTFALKTDGTMWRWGSNNNGQLGLNDLIIRSSPTQIPGTQWTLPTNSSGRAFALKSDNTLWAWGNNLCTFGYQSFALLGLNDSTNRSSPTQIPGNQWCFVSAGNGGAQHALAMKTDNTAWSWGYNSTGQLGQNSSGMLTARGSPVQIPGTWTKVGAGFGSSFGLKSDGTLWAWGSNIQGILGLGGNPAEHRSSPTQIPGTQWIDIPVQADEATFALKSDGTLWSWGINNNGLLGINDMSVGGRSSPVQIPGNQWSKVSASCCSAAAIKSDGTAWSWGLGSNGQLGLSTTISRSSPTQIPGTQWTDIAMSSVNGRGRRII